MVQPMDMDAQFDAETLVRAKEIAEDQGRMKRAQAYAEDQRDVMAKVASDITGSIPKGRFDGSVSGSRMNPGDGQTR